MQLLEILWPDAATLLWQGDELCDVSSGRRARLEGSLTSRSWNMTYHFDRAFGVRSHDANWAIIYTNRATKALLMKNGSIHRELNRSYYCAESYDYPITIGNAPNGRAVVIHCPLQFDVLEIQDAETGQILDSLKSRDMEFHSRLSLSDDGRFLIDAGWFWHPWCGAAVFEIEHAADGTVRFTKNAPAFSAQDQIDAAAFLGNDRLLISSAPDYLGEEPKPGGLEPKQLGVWSLTHRGWESKVNLSEPTGMLMPWKEWTVSFYGHPKLIELATGKILHRWDKINSGKQLGPIQLGGPPPPPIALDPIHGRFAVANPKSVTIVCL